MQYNGFLTAQMISLTLQETWMVECPGQRLNTGRDYEERKAALPAELKFPLLLPTNDKPTAIVCQHLQTCKMHSMHRLLDASSQYVFCSLNWFPQIMKSWSWTYSCCVDGKNLAEVKQSEMTEYLIIVDKVKYESVIFKMIKIKWGKF